ncbi:MAG: hypothetical protein JKY95_14165 [Planctomycetaceae bacterium]|nr:hypothetical protein [Planctomycetaceae bacterium]
MSKRKTFRVDQSRTPLIATTLVLVGGVATCLAIAAPFSLDMRYPIYIILGSLTGIFLVLGFLRQPTITFLSELQAMSEAKRKKKVVYEIKRLKPIPQTGPRKPPTAESIREILGK